MTYARIFVSLKITDNVARTALNTLRNRLGAGALRELRRSEFWEIGFPGLGAAGALAVAERLTRQTALFMNPNKHRCEIETGEIPLAEDESARPREGFGAAILVRDRNDGAAAGVLRSLEGLLSADEAPGSLDHGVWWSLAFEEGVDARGAAESLREAKSRREGFFANPHYQDSRVFAGGS